MIRRVDFDLLARLSEPQSRSTTMMRSTQTLLFFTFRHLARPQEVGVLSELPFNELLSQKKFIQDRKMAENMPLASALVEEPPDQEIKFKGLHKLPRKKTSYEENYEEDKDHMEKKKDEHKLHDILNTSIMALSYLAFGGYLLCMIASALREKRRRIMTTYPFDGSVTNNQFAQVLQHYMTQRPSRPFIRFPAVTLHHGGKKRRKRSNQIKFTQEEANGNAPLINIIDHVHILAFDGN